VQHLTQAFGDLHVMGWSAECQYSKISGHIYCGGDQSDKCPQQADFLCLFDHNWPDFLSVVSAHSKMDGW